MVLATSELQSPPRLCLRKYLTKQILTFFRCRNGDSVGRMALPKNDCILVGRWILHLLLSHVQSMSMERKCGRHRVKGAGEGVLGEGLETWEWLPSLGWMTPNL